MKRKCVAKLEGYIPILLNLKGRLFPKVQSLVIYMTSLEFVVILPSQKSLKTGTADLLLSSRDD